MTTFATPWGRYKWLRLPFGLKVSSEIFQKRLHQALDGLVSTRCIADDIIVWGCDDNEHDTHVRNLLQRCKDKDISLNQKKTRIGLTEVPFLGHIVSNEGLKLDHAKVEAIQKMEPPIDKDGVDRLRGMVNYMSKFIPNLASVMKPINDLTHKGVEWMWTSYHDKAFNKIKKLLTEAPVLSYYDPKKELVIHSDASNKGIGAVLLQEGRPVAYASRALTETESRYATIEKEMLAAIYALEKWHQYTFGRQVTLYSDHKPLESITLKPLEKAPKRLQGMLLRALAYNVDIKYLEGKKNLVADALSRSYLPYEQGQQELETVNALRYLTLPDYKIQEIRRMTSQDNSLQVLKETIQNGWPEHKSQLPLQVTPYFHFRDELTVYDGLVFRGERLVIPKEYRSTIKKDVHLGHSGVESTLRRAREHVYWPKMNEEIKEWIQSCETCRENEVSQAKLPLMSHDIPDRPWEKIGTDLLKYKDKSYLVTVCYKSNFWELDRLHRTTAEAVANKLKCHFSRYGIPDKMISDNGPPFSSHEFQCFTRELGITHNTISPYNSKSNGKVESAVKAAKKLLKKCSKTGEDLSLALLNLRNTPSQGIDSSPAQRFLGRRTKTLLPTTNSLLEPRVPESKHELEQLGLNQKRQAKYYDRTAKDLPPLKTNDTVRMKPFRLGDELWKKAIVVERLDERSYNVMSNGQTYRRNREHLKKTREPPPGDNFSFEDNSLPSSISQQEESPDTIPTGNNTEIRNLASEYTEMKLSKERPTPVPHDIMPGPRRSSRVTKEPARMMDYIKY